jgi:osmotically-inducible protein OsmY
MKRIVRNAPLVAIGGAIAYFFDPDQGRRRRAVARDRAMKMFRTSAREAERKGRYIAGKRHGVTHAFTPSSSGDTTYNDPTLQHKIESEALRNYPSERVNVNVEDGVVVLRGVLDTPDLINSLIADVRKVRGVMDVQSLLHLPNTPVPPRR